MAQFRPQQFISLTGHFFSDQQAVNTIQRSARERALGLVLPDSLSSAAIFRLAGIKSAGYQDDGRSLLLRWAFKKPEHPVHAVQKWWQLTGKALQAWSIDSPFFSDSTTAPEAVALVVSDSDRQAALNALLAHGLKPGQFVLLAPTATGTHHGKAKVWPHFGQLAQSLQDNGIKVAICPPPHEREQARLACPEATLLDPLPLKSFCGLTQLARLVICNDSGVSHLAAVAGANQLTLFGVTDPANTRPWSDKAQLLGANGRWPTIEAVLRKTLEMTERP